MNEALELEGWFYVGCGPREIGHYVWDHTGRKFRHHAIDFNWCDGTLQYPSYTQLYVATLSRLGGYGKSALAWWDCSADKRPKSSSTVLAPSLTIHPAELQERAKAIFPWVFERLPQPLTMHPISERVFGPLGNDIQKAQSEVPK